MVMGWESMVMGRWDGDGVGVDGDGEVGWGEEGK